MKRSMLFPFILLFIFKVGIGANILSHGEQAKEKALQTIHQYRFIPKPTKRQQGKQLFGNPININPDFKQAQSFMGLGIDHAQRMQAKVWAWIIITLLLVFCWMMLGILASSGFFGPLGVIAGYVFYALGVLFLIIGIVRIIQILGGDD